MSSSSGPPVDPPVRPALLGPALLHRVTSPVAVAVLVYVLGSAAVLLAPQGSRIAVWWPAAGVGVAAVALSVGTRRWAMLLAVAVGSLAANLAGGRPFGAACMFSLANTAEAALAGYWLGRCGRPRLATMTDLSRLLAAAAMGAVLAGLIGALAVALLGGDPWVVWWVVAASHGAAVVVLVPLVMRLPDRPVQVHGAELAAVWVVVLVAAAVVFGPGQYLPLVFIPVAVLAWTGLRLGVRTAAVQLVLVGVIASVLTRTGGGPFALAGREASPSTTGALVQLFLVACALVVLVLAVSVAQREAALAALADQRRFEQDVLEAVNAAVLACDADGRIVIRNAAHRRISGVGPDEQVTPAAVAARLVARDADGTEITLDRTPLVRALAGEVLTDYRIWLGPTGLDPYEVVATARPIHGADGRILGAVAACTDVTAERAAQSRLRDSLAFRDAVLAASPDLIVIVDATDRSVVWASRPPLESFGLSETDTADIVGDASIDAYAHPDDVARMQADDAVARDLADGGVSSLRFRIRNGAGEYRWFTRRVTPFARAADGSVGQLLGVVRDITDIVQVEELLADAALHDPLTGLPNRRLLTDRLRAALDRAAGSGRQVVVLFCDLDGFKHVNDTAGHAVGDAVLIAAANRLLAVLRPQDLVARVGGDEFVILLQPPSVTDEPTVSGAREQGRSVAARITRSLARPVDVRGSAHAVTVSVGVTLARGGDVPEDVLRDADAAMYHAKAHGKDRFAMFDDTMRADVSERRRVQQVLRAALREIHPVPGVSVPDGSVGLAVAYQPMVDLSTQQLSGVEALARLGDDQRRPVAPDVFIAIAEDTGLIAQLGRHVLDTACADLAAWHAHHPAWRRLGVSVNLSAHQADLTDLVAEVQAALARTGLAPPLLTVELTESVLIEAGHSTITALHRLRDLGVKIAIDDFGTGYASLRHLAQLPITGVKIDRSFTSGLPDDPTCTTIVRTIAGLARDLGLSCVAEGIETDAQLLALPPGLVGQGYLLGRPVPAARIDEQLAERTPHDGSRAAP